jgi:hypothetical protein
VELANVRQTLQAHIPVYILYIYMVYPYYKQEINKNKKTKQNKIGKIGRTLYRRRRVIAQAVLNRLGCRLHLKNEVTPRIKVCPT